MTQKYQVKVSMKQAAIVETGIVLKQGDFGMQLEIEVLDFDATGTTPQIVFRKAMGAVESTTITVSNNKYTYTFKGTELDTPGKVFCDLKLKNSTTQRISTASFMFRVVADTLDGLAEESSSYSDTIAQLMEHCIQKSETEGIVKNDGTIDTAIKPDVTYLQNTNGNNAVYNLANALLLATYEDGVYYDYQTGRRSVNGTYSGSSLVSVFPNTNYIFTNLGYNLHIAFYGANGNYISGVLKSSDFKTPANAAYLRISPKTADKATLVLKPITSYLDEMFNASVGATANFNYNNILKSSKLIDGFYVYSATGLLSPNSDYSVTGFIAVYPDTYYQMEKARHIAFYDSGFNYISGTNNKIQFSTPATAKYARFSIHHDDLATAVCYPLTNSFFESDQSILSTRPLNGKVVINKWIEGQYIYSVNGNVSTNANYSRTDYIMVNPKAKYTIISNSLSFALYDKDKTFIPGSSYGAGVTFTAPENACYMRFSCVTADIASLQITYTFDDIISEIAIAATAPQEEYDFADGYYRYYGTGIKNTATGWTLADFIPVNPEEFVAISPAASQTCFFDKDKQYISGYGGNRVFKTPEGCLYISVSMPIEYKEGFWVKRKVDRVELKEGGYIDFTRAFNDAISTELPLYVYGGEWDFTNQYEGQGFFMKSSVIGIGNPRFIAHPTTYNENFSILYIGAPSVNKEITIEGITFECSNMRYCIHDEMGGNTTMSAPNGYKHYYKNCRFIGGEDLIRPVGIGLGDNGLITFENCIFESNAQTPPDYLLDIHAGYQGQNEGTTAIVKDCLFLQGTCHFTEYQNYSGFKNTFVANNNKTQAAIAFTQTTGVQADFYEWNNVYPTS